MTIFTTQIPKVFSSANQSNLVLTSVVISALVSTLVSGIFLFLNEWLRRVSEEKRFKLDFALKIAELRERQFIKWIKHAPDNEMTVPSIVDLFRVHLEEIEKMWKKL